MYNDYIPIPVDTSGVELSGELIRLIDILARNMHESRAKEFLDSGWRFGDSMNIVNRTLPDLMPYDELTDIQKERYVSTASSIVKTMTAIGFKFKKTDI